MLSLGSLAVAPLRPVAAGEGWILWDDDLDGADRRPRPFFDAEPSSGTSVSFSLELSAAACGISSIPRAMLLNGGDVGGINQRILLLPGSR